MVLLSLSRLSNWAGGGGCGRSKRSTVVHVVSCIISISSSSSSSSSSGGIGTSAMTQTSLGFTFKKNNTITKKTMCLRGSWGVRCFVHNINNRL